MMNMKYLLQAEDGARFALSIFFVLHEGFSIWLFLALLLLPDLSMVGYLISPRWGAWLYNVAHHQALGIVLAFGGFMMGMPALLLSGLVLVAHSAMDRMLGYGLKFEDDFKHTHLGWIGKPRS